MNIQLNITFGVQNQTWCQKKKKSSEVKLLFTCTKSGIVLSPLMTILLWTSLARM